MASSTLNARIRELTVRARAAMTPARRRHPIDGDPEAGQGMVEYALILLLIAVVVIVVLTIVGGTTHNVFSNISSGLGT
jgi:pilus assembly protein Flp/PilA